MDKKTTIAAEAKADDPTASADKADEPAASAETTDHPDPTNRPRNKQLSYPHDERIPADAELIEVAKGLYWTRIPLPFKLDHINVYLADEGDHWTLIDTGANNKAGRQMWEKLESESLNGKPIKRIIGTHMHMDHIGLAGDIARRFDADLWMTQGEFLTAHYLWHAPDGADPEDEIGFLLQAGMSEEYAEGVRQFGFGGFRKGISKLPRSYERIQDGSRFHMAGEEWIVIIGRGHSPEHACLYCPALDVMVGGDQVLPTISSNVSVYATEPMANPLVDWLLSLERLASLKADPLVLPAHGRVFKSYHKRLYGLIEGHDRQLQRLLKALAEKPRTGVTAIKPLFGRVITGFDFILALGESLAHIHLLESIGVVEREKTDGVYQFRATGKAYPDNMLDEIRGLPGRGLRGLGDFGLGN